MNIGAVITVIKKIGEKVLSIIEYPFVHSIALEKMLADVAKDTPLTAKAMVGTLKQFEALGPDLITAIAADGLSIPADLKVGTDLKALFTQVKDELFPAIEQEAHDLAGDAKLTAPDPAPAVPVAPAATAKVPGRLAPA